jgi:hypothetical protein
MIDNLLSFTVKNNNIDTELSVIEQIEMKLALLKSFLDDHQDKLTHTAVSPHFEINFWNVTT